MEKLFVRSCTLIFLLITYKCVSIDLDDIELSDCTDGSSCVGPTSPTQINDDNSTEKSGSEEFNTTTENSIELVNNDETSSTMTTIQEPFTTTAIPTTTIKNDFEEKFDFETKSNSNVCTCDIKISSCDVNCCCDPDCSDFQIAVFSRCINHRAKKYDSRYCYTQNFIQRNNTKFILERLANNLFCIAYDNLPPVYGISEVPALSDRKKFQELKDSVNRKQRIWEWSDNLLFPPEFNFSSQYRDKENVWIFHEDDVDTMKLPQSGFMGRCTFDREVKYLEDSEWRCLQTELSNNNSFLYSEIFTNFAIISSPHLFNSSYLTLKNNTCPKETCLSPRILYCSERWTECDPAKPAGRSCLNGKCENVVKKIRYTFFHNGTEGIRSVEARIALANASLNYYQYYEIRFEWTNERRGNKLLRSGNPGYIIGKPIVIGKLVTNVTNEARKEHVGINASNYYLTLPMRGKSPNCDSGERYRVGFGENVRLQCNVQKTTSNFSSSATCMELQNETLRLMTEDSLRGVKEVGKYQIYVSKIGDLSKNSKSDWVQILLDKVPRNVVTGQIFGKKIRCSALVTSLHVEVLYTILPSQEGTDHFKIAGVALTFSEPRDYSWNRCVSTNCLDVIDVRLTSLVTFTDISTPSMYYYAGGPNLDITLPYDFFYPFMSSARGTRPCYFLVALLIIFSRRL